MKSFEIPCLTEEPTKRKSKSAIWTSLFVLLVISFSYMIFGPIDGYKTYDFFAITTIILFLYMFHMLWLFSGNIIIIFRFFLLATPIFVTSYIWWQYEGSVHVHYMGHEYQTLKATYMVVFGGVLSAIGSAIGWFFGMLYFENNINNTDKLYFYDYILTKYKKILITGLYGALFFGFAYYYVSGGSILSTGGYGQGELIKLNFSVYNVFQIFFASLVLISVSIKKISYKISLIILIFSFFLGVMAGSRADYLLPILFLIIMLIDGNTLNEFYIKTKKIIFQRYYKLFLLIFIGFFLALAIGFWRHNVEMSLLRILIEYLEDIPNVLFKEMRGYTVFWMETVNHMIGGFYAFVQKIELGYVDYYYGLDYLNYVPRALPGIIRPESLDALDLAWDTDINGIVMTQGGIFEPAEAYANFGFIGCFLISFLISFFFAWLLKKAKKDYSIFFMSWYIVNGFMLPRAIWYQNFVFIRIATVMLFFYIVLYFLRQRWFFGINPIFSKLKSN